mmetsp:Transcript_106824/g.344650  ORF Transcript_106824/g.344650 Transcript_106824/m.344650 type:complete len:204 (-) Transcript_106824:293-904(-)
MRRAVPCRQVAVLLSLIFVLLKLWRLPHIAFRMPFSTVTPMSLGGIGRLPACGVRPLESSCPGHGRNGSARGLGRQGRVERRGPPPGGTSGRGRGWRGRGRGPLPEAGFHLLSRQPFPCFRRYGGLDAPDRAVPFSLRFAGERQATHREHPPTGTPQVWIPMQRAEQHCAFIQHVVPTGWQGAPRCGGGSGFGLQRTEPSNPW